MALSRLVKSAALVALLASTPSLADQIHLTNAEMLDLQAGLRALGGLHDVIIKEGGSEKSVSVPYKLKAAVVDIISRDLLALKPLNDALDTTKNALGQQIMATPEGKERNDLERGKNEEFRKLLLDSIAVELTLIDPKDLDREGVVSNPIPALVMAQIRPVLKVEDKK